MLPRLLLLTDRRQATRPLGEVIRSAIDGGARAVVLREKDLPQRERARLAAELRPLLADVHGSLLVASDTSIAADGVHLAADDPLPRVRPPIVGRSCHDAREVRGATAERLDHVTLSPVATTASKPGHGPALGHAGLQRLCAATAVPVYALGGVNAGNARSWLAAGAYGVAVMGAVMRADRPDRAVADLFAALRSDG
jgi:thiamine-phosphate pyrophosphorylase